MDYKLLVRYYTKTKINYLECIILFKFKWIIIHNIGLKS